jgi:hypothetical protein
VLQAPLLFVVDGDTALIGVGRAQVVGHSNGQVSVTAFVYELWVANSRHGASGSRSWKTEDAHESLEGAVIKAWDRIAHKIPTSPEYRTVAVAKALTEHSRDFVKNLQSLRYDSERALGQRLRGTTSDDVQVLADLVELGIAANRARDFALDAMREGLWLWDWDSPAYHAQRRSLDPTLPERPITADVSRAWLGTFDAAVRQCASMSNELEQEIDQFHRLMEAGSTMSAAREAKAQEHFNLVATLAAIVLGLPSLVLAAYGAGDTMTIDKLMWMWPLAVCGAVTFIAAMMLPGGWKRRLQRAASSSVAVFIAVGMLAFAAWAIH